MTGWQVYDILGRTIINLSFMMTTLSSNWCQQVLIWSYRLQIQFSTSVIPVTSTTTLSSRWKPSMLTRGVVTVISLRRMIRFKFRLILETAGLGWVAPSHQNDRGSHSSQETELAQLFGNSSKQVITGIIERYYMDFKICGYEETLQQLILLANGPAVWSEIFLILVYFSCWSY